MRTTVAYRIVTEVGVGLDEFGILRNYPDAVRAWRTASERYPRGGCRILRCTIFESEEAPSPMEQALAVARAHSRMLSGMPFPARVRWFERTAAALRWQSDRNRKY